MPSSPSPSWRYTTDPLSEKAIKSAERALGVEFPPDYRACVRENHGGAPEPSGFVVEVEPGRTEARTVGLLLTLDTREPENVVRTRSETPGLPDGLVPIMDDGGGDFVCLDYRSD